MTRALVALHATSASVWLGCILTEALFERALVNKGALSRQVLAQLHVKVDTLIEVPALLTVFATGLVLYSASTRAGSAFHVMLVAGACAFIANLLCVWLVFCRKSAADQSDWKRFEQLDNVQHKLGAVVLIGVLVALLAGFAAGGA